MNIYDEIMNKNDDELIRYVNNLNFKDVNIDALSKSIPNGKLKYILFKCNLSKEIFKLCTSIDKNTAREMVLEYFKKCNVKKNKIELIRFLDNDFIFNDVLNFLNEEVEDVVICTYSEVVNYIRNSVIYGDTEAITIVFNSDKLVKYTCMNDLEEHFIFDEEEQDKVYNCDYDKFFHDEEYNSVSNELLIKRFSSNKLKKILPFEFMFSNSDLYEQGLEWLDRYIREYLDYDKAIMFVNCLDFKIDDKNKLLKNIYGDKFSDIESEYIKILENSNIEDLNSINYDSKYMDKLVKNMYDIKDIRDMEILLNQIVKKFIKENNIELNDIDFSYGESIDRLDDYTASQFNRDNNSIYVNINTKDINLYEFLMGIYHELRHVYQYNKYKDTVSVNALMSAMDIIMSDNIEEHYEDNYDDLYFEIDALNYSYYNTYKLLDEEHRKEFMNVCDLSLVDNHRHTNEDAYFGNIFYEFMNIDKDIILKEREKFKVLKFITKDSGEFYSEEEIRSIVNNMKVNDIKSASIRGFYINYLEKLESKNRRKERCKI